MSSLIEDIQGGGRAFPSTDGAGIHHSGMSMRDWFAGQAFAALVSNKDIMVATLQVAKAAGMTPHAYSAQCAYEGADALLSARAKKGVA